MSGLRSVLRAVTPPILWRGLQALKRLGGQASWQLEPRGFAAAKDTRGWNLPALVELQRANWPAWLAACAQPAMLGVNVEASRAVSVDLGQHNTLICYAYAVARAAEGKRRLAMLDWGGGLGHYAPLTRGLLPGLTLDYSCYDLPLFCQAGRLALPGDRFLEKADEALADRYDFVLASSSLWYEEDWRGRLAQLAQACSGHLYLTRQLVLESAPSFVALQRPAAMGYPTEYLCWVLKRAELLAEAERCGLKLERELYIHPGPEIAGSPENADYRGYLFSRR